MSTKIKNRVRTYYGVTIYPKRGGWWTSAPVDGIGSLMADTLDGMKELIRHYTKKGTR